MRDKGLERALGQAKGVSTSYPKDSSNHTHVSKVGENYCLECGEKLQPETVKDSSSDLEKHWDKILGLMLGIKGAKPALEARLTQERNRVLDLVTERLREDYEHPTIEHLEGYNRARKEVKKILEEIRHESKS